MEGELKLLLGGLSLLGLFYWPRRWTPKPVQRAYDAIDRWLERG